MNMEELNKHNLWVNQHFNGMGRLPIFWGSHSCGGCDHWYGDCTDTAYGFCPKMQRKTSPNFICDQWEEDQMPQDLIAAYRQEEERYRGYLRGDVPDGSQGQYIHMDALQKEIKKRYLECIPRLGL